MASGKRQPSKQKRTNQNRQERAARQARASNAAAAPSSAGRSSSGTGAGRGSLLGRLRGAATGTTAPSTSRATDSGGAASGGSTPRRGFDPSQQPPGYRAALTALLAAGAAVIASFFLTQPVDGQGEVYTRPAIVAEWATSAVQQVAETPDADADAIVQAIGDDWMPHRDSERMFIAYLPLSLAAVLPVIAAYLLFRSVQQRRGAKIVNRAMYATLLGAFISLPLLQFFLPTVIAGWVAGFQVRKAERNELLAAQAAQAEAGGTDGDVIEADVVDAEVVDAPVDADDDKG
jgi:hypothetical protein